MSTFVDVVGDYSLAFVEFIVEATKVTVTSLTDVGPILVVSLFFLLAWLDFKRAGNRV